MAAGGQIPEDFSEAFDELFACAYRVALRLVGNAGAAEDIAAEALARTYARWSRVRGYEHRRAWVCRIVTNLAIDEHRKRPRHLIASDPTPHDEALLRITLIEALKRLPAKQRAVVTLRYLADLSEADVAASMRVSRGTVKTQLHRGINRLRDVLGPEFDPNLAET